MDNKPLWEAIQTLEKRITQLEEALRSSAKDWTFVHNEIGKELNKLKDKND